MDKDKIIIEAMARINKQYGRGTIVAMDDSAASEPIDIIPTGIAAIDSIIGCGGIPRGRVTEVYGPESGGKSTFCLQVTAMAQKAGGKCLYIDIENSLDSVYAAQLGVNVPELLISQPECGEDALEVAEEMIKTEKITLVVVDSVAALVPRAELEGDMGDAQMGLQARLMSQAMRKLNYAVKASQTSLMFINQVRDKIGVTFGSPETTTGGRALKFYAGLRIDIRRISQIKKGEVIIGANTKVKIAKTKFGPPLKFVDVPLIYGKGFVNEE